MAQLLLIKDANTAQKEVDDIIGFFEDSHRFSDDENLVFNIQQVKGYTREDLKLFALNKKSLIEAIFRMSEANIWSFKLPDREHAWKHVDSKWYMLSKDPKYMWTIKNMTVAEKAILANEESSSFDRLNALAHLECKVPMYLENMTEIVELNI